MSQTQIIPPSLDDPLSKSSAINNASANFAQVAPQDMRTTTKKKAKSTKYIDPEYIKLPLPASSHPTSRTSSLKASIRSKGSFLSLLLCCTVGAGTYLDNDDKSSAHNKRNKRHGRTSTAAASTADSKQPEKPSPLPPTPLQDRTNISTAATILPIINTTDLHTTSEENDPEAATPASIPQSSHEILSLLPPLASEHSGRKCLVLDLDETLVHSSFKSIPNPDFVVPVEIDNQFHNVYVLKRPGVDEFMRKMGERYEIVVFTASLSKYADPVLDMLDIHKVVKHRLFRESCFNHRGSYVKDLSQLGRDLTATLILDNSPASYIFHTANAVPVSTWFNDPHDTELMDLIAFLEDLTVVEDVTMVLDSAIDANYHSQ
ncbi:hypothetical protein DFQ28_006242 [Apophysomyces sp. BC1034]|nr:hypothetical protein DFQ30_006317 [Apophysomyces sp. BC1015]KAG0177010.1 hypothetical protein DFQ29_005352 [Apophysomyces sp. BC1021]KAG0187528.1 hypothetical protein DFQ28_006242 [Apophysomyces sp. BC1034]